MTHDPRSQPELLAPVPDLNEPTIEAVQVIEGWRAEDLAAPLSAPIEDIICILNEAVCSGTVVRLECGGETLYASGRLARHREAAR